ncbi:MAG: hypothetical protein P1U89_12460 [Verrucomicrobiales bacterium]|nr:hypothetical protein [Verrucomicrobiales bacterium]
MIYKVQLDDTEKTQDHNDNDNNTDYIEYISHSPTLLRSSYACSGKVELIGK